MQFMRVIGIVPLGIGATLLVFLWGAPFNQFGSPPLFFRVFGSFVALGFVMFGLAALRGAASGAQLFNQLRHEHPGPRPAAGAPGPIGYSCPACGARLGDDADTSPHGDVKCAHCGRWFNIHQAG